MQKANHLRPELACGHATEQRFSTSAVNKKKIGQQKLQHFVVSLLITMKNNMRRLSFVYT